MTESDSSNIRSIHFLHMLVNLLFIIIEAGRPAVSLASSDARIGTALQKDFSYADRKYNCNISEIMI